MHGAAYRGSTRATQQPLHVSFSPLAPRLAVRAAVKASAGNCPYSTLGVSANASDTEIKQAYRKLVLQYHPDVCQSSGADRRFMTIQQAYELLTGKSRSAEGHSAQHGDWDFHDWYWSFMQKRRWGSYKKGSAAAAAAAAAGQAGHDAAGAAGPSFHQQPEHKNTLRSQLAGLRHRAAIRAHKRGPRWSAAAAGEAGAESGTESDNEQQQEQQHKQPEAMASLDIDSSEMGDGCNMSSGITDWEAAAAAHAAATAKRRFSATERRKEQVMSQVAGLHRMASAHHDGGGLW